MKKILLILLISVSICIFHCSAEDIEDLALDSKFVYMVNLDNSQVLVEKNAFVKTEPASLTKIMTALVVLENCKDIETEKIHINDDSLFYEIKKEGGSNIALKQGETLSVKDLLYAVMLPSACDAAELLAYHFGQGNIQNFVDKMNERAVQIGAKNTFFKNAHGLSAEGHFTTAYDMYLIASEALKNEKFREIAFSFQHTIPATEKSSKRNLKHTVELVNPNSQNYYKYASGIKTGFTDQAGRCLITTAEKDGTSYLLVLLGANINSQPQPIRTFGDATNLFENAFNGYSLVSIAGKGDIISNALIKFSHTNKKPIKLAASQNIDLVLPNGFKRELLTTEIENNDDLKLPLVRGDHIGKIKYIYNGVELKSFDLLCGSNVYDNMPQEKIEYYPAKGFNVITLYKILLIVADISCIAGIIFIFKYKNLKRKFSIIKRKINK